MKFLLRIIMIVGLAYLFFYLYKKQLGSIPFLFISIFLFYISYRMYHSARKEKNNHVRKANDDE